jgi:hypothetical protein
MIPIMEGLGIDPTIFGSDSMIPIMEGLGIDPPIFGSDQHDSDYGRLGNRTHDLWL